MFVYAFLHNFVFWCLYVILKSAGERRDGHDNLVFLMFKNIIVIAKSSLKLLEIKN